MTFSCTPCFISSLNITPWCCISPFPKLPPGNKCSYSKRCHPCRTIPRAQRETDPQRSGKWTPLGICGRKLQLPSGSIRCSQFPRAAEEWGSQKSSLTSSPHQVSNQRTFLPTHPKPSGRGSQALQNVASKPFRRPGFMCMYDEYLAEDAHWHGTDSQAPYVSCFRRRFPSARSASLLRSWRGWWCVSGWCTFLVDGKDPEVIIYDHLCSATYYIIIVFVFTQEQSFPLWLSLANNTPDTHQLTQYIAENRSSKFGPHYARHFSCCSCPCAYKNCCSYSSSKSGVLENSVCLWKGSPNDRSIPTPFYGVKFGNIPNSPLMSGMKKFKMKYKAGTIFIFALCTNNAQNAIIKYLLLNVTWNPIERPYSYRDTSYLIYLPWQHIGYRHWVYYHKWEW